MILLSAENLSRQFDAEPVFSNVSFDVRPGEKLGLVGPNGCGKTTLLNILAGLDEPDTGSVGTHPSAGVALLEQEADFPPGRTLLDEAKSGLADLYALQSEAVELAETMAAETDPGVSKQLHRRYDHVQHELDRLDAYNIDHRVDEVLIGLGFEKDDFNRPLEQFSGGQQSRALLARMLLRAPELMLLDEPTNHLDIASAEWLENYLASSERALIVVSHDRYFLDRVTNRILELTSGTVSHYSGNFSAYWNQRAERNKVLDRTYKKQQEYIAKTEDFIRRNKYGQKHAQASDREKQLERLEPVAKPRDISGPSMQFGSPSRTGDWVIDAVDLTKGFDEPLFIDFTLRISRGDRIGILGPNGSGKTTLLRTLLGDLEPDCGSVRLGTGVKVGYFDQQLASVDGNFDALDAVRPPVDASFSPADARKLLARFGIYGDMVFQQVGQMSGGERNKVALARVAAANVNLLVLDEPTNHLDLWARASLEEALKAFEGTLLFVSHDRYFIDRVARAVVVLEPDRWRYYEGNYSAYTAFIKNHPAATSGKTSAKASSKSDSTRPGRSSTNQSKNQSAKKMPRRKRRFEYRKVVDLEADIAAHEAKLEQLHADLVNPAIHRDGNLAKETTEAYEATKAKLAELYEHWEEASEMN